MMKKKGTYFGGCVKKKPLLSDEQEILFDVAKGKIYRGIDVYKTVMFFIDTGVHRVVVADLKKYKLHTKIYNLPKKNGLYIEWYRPKKPSTEGYTSIKASRRIRDWVVGFVKDLKPIYKEFYNELCMDLQKHIKRKYPSFNFYDGEKLSPVTFRHTCCCNLMIKGMPDNMVSQVLNVNQKTLKFYANFVGGMVDDFYNKIDW